MLPAQASAASRTRPPADEPLATVRKPCEHTIRFVGGLNPDDQRKAARFFVGQHVAACDIEPSGAEASEPDLVTPLSALAAGAVTRYSSAQSRFLREQRCVAATR